MKRYVTNSVTNIALSKFVILRKVYIIFCMGRIILKPTIKLIIALAIIVVAFWLAQYIKDSEFARGVVGSYGYIGVFVISFISGLNLIVPVPAFSFVPLFLESGLTIWMIIVVMTIGMAFADSIAYFIGYSGRKLAKTWGTGKTFKHLDVLQHRYYWGPVVILFLYATLVPFPNELILIPLGFLGYKLRHLFLPYFAGNLIFNTFASFGIVNLFNFF